MPPKENDPKESAEDERRRQFRKAQKKREESERTLLANLKSRKAELAALLESCSDHWGYEAPIYRFYHQSFKAFRLQEATEEIVSTLQSLLPEQPLNDWFLQIIQEGTGREFTLDMNDDWTSQTRPIVEAFFHARYMLEMAVRYADLPAAPQPMPSGWAAFLSLFNLP